MVMLAQAVAGKEEAGDGNKANNAAMLAKARQQRQRQENKSPTRRQLTMRTPTRGRSRPFFRSPSASHVAADLEAESVHVEHDAENAENAENAEGAAGSSAAGAVPTELASIRVNRMRRASI